MCEKITNMQGMCEDIKASARPAKWRLCNYDINDQFNENAIKSLLKTHEPIFHGHENGDSPFHGLCQAHENSIKYYLT